MQKFNKKQFINTIKNVLIVILGTAILAFGTAIFIVPFDLITGGVSGIAIILSNLIPLNLSIDFYISILTWFLFILGLIFLGKQFAAKTLISSLFYPIFFFLFYKLVDPNILNGIFVLQNSQYQDIAVLIASIFGGVFVGLGCALSFLGGGSTGGVDILAFMICKWFKRLKSTHVIFLIDAIVIIMGVFAIGDIVLSLIGIISAFVCSMLIDKVFLGSSTAYVAQIVTDKSALICNQVINKMDRTATIIDAKGAYSGQQKQIVIVSFSIREYATLINIVNQTDSKAFVTVYRAHETHGEGWTQNNI
jgi:uncharacterized membrane-anchored protein YitT (DUF2179 family)